MRFKCLPAFNRLSDQKCWNTLYSIFKGFTANILKYFKYYFRRRYTPYLKYKCIFYSIYIQ